MTAHRFIKMHGLGNDFVVFDARITPISLSRECLIAIADRRTGIGCDQIITLEPSKSADLTMRIHNSDGGEAEACGNAARCVAKLVMKEKKSNSAIIQVASALLHAYGNTDGLISVDMGMPKFHWKEIPLSSPQDTLHMRLERDALTDPVAINMGNPHAVFFVRDVTRVPLERLGPDLENHSIFPERANIGVAEVRSQKEIRLRVWERGAGLTPACGTGACAALVAAHQRNLCDREAEIHVDGGAMHVEWKDNDHVLLTGPATLAFVGEVDTCSFS